MRLLILCTMLISLTGCGGGGSSNNDDVAGVCDNRDINSKIFCALQQDYLWYQDLPAVINPLSYNSPQAMLEAVKAPQDRYSFLMTEQEYTDRYVNATFFGYGFSQRRVDNDTAFQVVYVYDDGSAAENGLRRGDKITEIEGVSVAEWISRLDAGTATNDDVFGPNEDGVVRHFVWHKPDDTQLSADFIKGNVTTNTVLHRSVLQSGGKRVGYLVFNSFIELSETELEQAFSYFKQQNIDELVLDVRYNGGGLIRVANQLASQVALSSVQGQVFVKYQYNDKNTKKNTTTLFSLGKGSTHLDLTRLVVLTTASSCSSSELVINALSPFVDVVQVGSTTCGKPVGQQPDIIDDFVLFAINFQTVNALDQGGYFDGLQPNCQAEDEVIADWGQTADPLLAEALYYLGNDGCSMTGATAVQSLRQSAPILSPATPWQLTHDQ